MSVDGLDPPGEQLELFPMVTDEVVETTVHRVQWGPRSWSCACGLGNTWAPDVAPWRPRQVAVVHINAVRRRIARNAAP